MKIGGTFFVSTWCLGSDTDIPNATTVRTFEATDEGRELVVCKNADDMFTKLGI